jgi:hypothetical protein
LIGAPRRPADYFHFDVKFLSRVANRIVNEVRGTNRVAYDLTSNPRHDRVELRLRQMSSCVVRARQCS